MIFIDSNMWCYYFDKRLPTEDEWEYAAQNAKETARTSGETLPPNKFGVKNMGGNIREWVVRVTDDRKSGRPIKPQGGFAYSGLVIGKSFPPTEGGTQGISKTFSYPWQGFSDVGFRCAASINQSVTW